MGRDSRQEGPAVIEFISDPDAPSLPPQINVRQRVVPTLRDVFAGSLPG